ncbi:shikimate dehydrogenase [Shimia sp. R9_1]|uniref:shikimate dehydrogenase n=1 Tax=Shimia sp. R9_1 TaxID=2821111 RepID=UPI001ADBCE26|nr:shikimate dehydrogenase [Shimia sp. R9_1]MBO9409661.1 shikimate dehydrogenase [Shimia sp. R9_1]
MKAALIGKNTSGSLTPKLHEQEGKAQGFAYSYSRIDPSETHPDLQSVSECLEWAEAHGLAGVNVTYPFKNDAVAYVDELSPIARKLASVNTVVFRDGRRIGHNTDYGGFSKALEEVLQNQCKTTCVLFGAGGAASAVGLALLDAGVQNLTVIDPQQNRAKELSESLSALRPGCTIAHSRLCSYDTLVKANGVVNATPLGMGLDQRKSFDPAKLTLGTWVADIVYFPLETPLLQTARTCGLTVMSGRGMAFHQAAEAFQLITGRQANVARMSAHFSALLEEKTPHSETEHV